MSLLCPYRYFYFVFAFCEVVQRKQKRVDCVMANLLSRFREWLRKINAISN